jgi:hypothetical protein
VCGFVTTSAYAHIDKGPWSVDHADEKIPEDCARRLLMVSCGRPEGLRTVWSCLLAFLFATTSAYAQMIYQQRDVSTNDPQPFLTAPSTASCVDGAGNAIADKSVPDGGFVKNCGFRKI